MIFILFIKLDDGAGLVRFEADDVPGVFMRLSFEAFVTRN